MPNPGKETRRPRSPARARRDARPSPRPAVPGDGHGLRQVLVGAAVELVEGSGTRGLSWREIARRAGVSHSAAYRHFENKEGLLAAVAEEGFRTLTARMEAEERGARGGAAHRLEAMAVAYVEFASERPSHFRLMFGRDVPDISQHPGLRAAQSEAIDLFRSAVTTVLDDAGGETAVLDADRFALMAWSLVHGLASLIVDGRVGDVADASLSPAEQVRSMTGLVETLLRGAQQ